MTQRERIADEADLRRADQEDAAANLHTAAPGIVKGVDLAAQTVVVQVALQGWTVDEQGEKHFQDLPLLLDVPIVWPRAGGFALTFPIKEGDECLVVFGERCIDAWWQSGGVQKPIDSRMHDLSDGFAIFGITSQPRRLPDVKDDAVELRTEDRSDWISLHKGSLDIHIEGATNVYTKTVAHLECDTLQAVAKSSATIDTPTTTITGDTKINGTLTVDNQIVGKGGMTVSGGSGAAMQVTGDMETTGDVTAGNISLQNHVHTEQGDGKDVSKPH